MGLLPHPSYQALNQFSDGELPAARHERVAGHLADCSQCRTYVSFIRQSGKLARSLEPVEAPDHTLDAILERRASGERVLLPRRPPGAQPEKRRVALPAIAAVLTLLVVGVFASASILEADRAALQIRPERSRAGELVQFQYQGGTRFAHEDRLKLRARFRTADGRSWQQIAAILERGDAQVFRAQLDLPDSVVYAAFAVEDMAGENVDSRNRRLWDVLVLGADGKPTLDALNAAHEDLYSRGLSTARDMAETAVDLYPDSPEAWVMLWNMDQHFSLLEQTASLHAERFRDLEIRMSEDPTVEPNDMAWLALYAFRVGELGSADYWAREAERRGASTEALFQAKVVQLRLKGHTVHSEALADLEGLWQRARVPIADVAVAGWRASLEAADWQAAMRWLPRYRATRTNLLPEAFIRELAGAFEADHVLDWALTHAEEALHRSGSHRPLHMSTTANFRSAATSRQATLSALARLALAEDRRALGTRLAREAVPLAWVTTELETLGSILFEIGDTVEATVAFARAAADPRGGDRVPSAISRLPGWSAALEEARSELTEHVLEQAVVGYVNGVDIVGDRPRGAEVLQPPMVVAFLAGCREVVPVNALVERLGASSVTIVPVAGAGATPGALRECGYTARVRPDPEGDLRIAMGAIGLDQYFIVDTAGRIRFEHTTPEEIPRQLFALERVSASTTIAD